MISFVAPRYNFVTGIYNAMSSTQITDPLQRALLLDPIGEIVHPSVSSDRLTLFLLYRLLLCIYLPCIPDAKSARSRDLRYNMHSDAFTHVVTLSLNSLSHKQQQQLSE